MFAERRSIGRRGRVIRVASALVALGTVVLVVAGPSAAATRECFLLTQCTPVVGPWVVIPAADRGVPIPAGVNVSCPDSDRVQLAVGSDYERSGGGLPPADVTRYMTGPGIGLVTGASAFFFAVNFSDTPASFRAHVGCIPQPRAQTALQAASDESVRTREIRLHPSRTVTGSHRCRDGERLVRGLAGVRFHRRRPPTARELRHVTVTHRTTRQRVRARVRTGPTVGDRERVTLQILAVCAR